MSAQEQDVATMVRKVVANLAWEMTRIMFWVAAGAGLLLFVVTALWTAIRWLAVSVVEQLAGLPVTAAVETMSLVWKTYNPPPPSATERIKIYVSDAIEPPLDFYLETVGVPNTIRLLVLGVGLWLSSVVWSNARTYLLRRRLEKAGLELFTESLVAGSAFLEGPAPAHTVLIYKPALVLTDTYVGQGQRVKNWLVMPYHVFKEAGGEEGLILEKPGTTLRKVVKGYVVISRLANDLVYVRLPAHVWADMRVSDTPKAYRVREAVIGHAWGYEGKSTGKLYRAPTVEHLIYGGSTQPGYSGCAYSVGTQWAGMHLGSVLKSQKNMGVKAELIVHEVNALEREYTALQPENYPQEDPGEEADKYPKGGGQKTDRPQNQSDLDDELLERRFRSVYPNDEDDWAHQYSKNVQKDYKKFTETSGPSWIDLMDMDEESSVSKARKVLGRLTASDRKLVLNAAMASEQASLFNQEASGSWGGVYQAQSPGGAIVSLGDEVARQRLDKLEAKLDELWKDVDFLFRDTTPYSVFAEFDRDQGRLNQRVSDHDEYFRDLEAQIRELQRGVVAVKPESSAKKVPAKQPAGENQKKKQSPKPSQSKASAPAPPAKKVKGPAPVAIAGSCGHCKRKFPSLRQLKIHLRADHPLKVDVEESVAPEEAQVPFLGMGWTKVKRRNSKSTSKSLDGDGQSPANPSRRQSGRTALPRGRSC